MSKNKKKILKDGKNNNQELVEMAAEQLAYLLWEQIKHNRKGKSSNSNRNNLKSD